MLTMILLSMAVCICMVDVSSRLDCKVIQYIGYLDFLLLLFVIAFNKLMRDA